MDTWLISLLSLSYLGLMFVVAHWGEKLWGEKRHQVGSNPPLPGRPWIYSLALGSCGTSWAFYGTVGQAASTGWWLAPIYVGTIACMLLAWPLLKKILHIAKSQNITSLADFIACRYGRSTTLGVLLTLVTLVGLIPYIALQLRAVSTSFDILTGSLSPHDFTAVKVTILMALFSILFGTRKVMTSDHNPGLMLVIATSSIVKLIALLVVGIFVTQLVSGDNQMTLLPPVPVTDEISEAPVSHIISQIVLGALTIFSLPRLFHLMIIENNHLNELKTARWLLPLYLVGINIFVLPIAWVGQQLFSGQGISADSFVLTIPLAADQPWIALMAYLGGLAAASAMIVVASIVLSTMLANEIVTPFILRNRLLGSHYRTQLQSLLLGVRRFGILFILMLALLFHEYSAKDDQLAGLGLLSFVLLVQCIPAMLGGLYWRRASKLGAIAGVLAGTGVWIYTMALPTLWPEWYWLTQGPFGLEWLRPDALFYLADLDTISHGLFYSLLFNCGSFVVISLLSQRSIAEKLQAEAFLRQADPRDQGLETSLSVMDLHNLLNRFVGEHKARQLLAEAPMDKRQRKASAKQLLEAQHLLSGVIGSASTRMVMKAARQDQEMPLEDVVGIVDEAQEVLNFNRELLQAAVENIDQGISVIDADMCLVAWNSRYQELMNYPSALLITGQPIRTLLEYNAGLGLYGEGQPTEQIERRINHMRNGNKHLHRRQTPDGRVLEIRGQPMPGGGFVTSFSDITDHIQAEAALKQANESLERRVAERTRALSDATRQAESANLNKSRFLAAASHDLMQPFNALSLFTSMLQQQTRGGELHQLADHIASSLSSAEALLGDLLDISKLDAGQQQPQLAAFSLAELLQPLANEFTLMAQQQGLSFHFVPSSALIYSDLKLLRRVVQNLLSNAVRYTHSGKILLGVRRHGDSLRIQVWDTGPGIPSDKQEVIFQEFTRLSQEDDRRGLGLGLAISQRISLLLRHPLTLTSTVGRGTCFSIDIPRASASQLPVPKPVEKDTSSSGFSGLEILILDNDPLVQTAMESLFHNWGCCPRVVGDQQQLLQLAKQRPQWRPQLILADYHLDNGENGVTVIQEWLASQTWSSPCIVNSADPSEELRQHTIEAGYSFLRKPLKTIALKRMMRQLLAQAESV